MTNSKDDDDEEDPDMDEDFEEDDELSGSDDFLGSSSNESQILNKEIIFEHAESSKFSDHKITAVRAEATIKQELPKYMFHHNNKWRMRWDLFIIVLALYNCISIPLNVAFPDGEESKVVELFERIVDVLFACDIIITFRTTFINPKTNLEVTDPKRAAKNYFFSNRFWVDLMASIPFEMFY